MVHGNYDNLTTIALAHFQKVFGINDRGANAPTQEFMLKSRHDGLPDFDPVCAPPQFLQIEFQYKVEV